MNRKPWLRCIGIGAFAISISLPFTAAAQEAFVHGPINLRAGPGIDYPVVVRLERGQPLDVLGCTSGYSWCDVVLPDGLRGWVSASGLDYAYRQRRVPIATYGAVIGVPIIGFSLGNYWSDHYRDRSWYGDRRYWRGGPPPPPVAGWRPAPAPRPQWQPNPWRDPGYAHGNRPGPGFRPQQDPGFHPPPAGGGLQQPRPDVRPPRPGPGQIPVPGPGFPQPQGAAERAPGFGHTSPGRDRP